MTDYSITWDGTSLRVNEGDNIEIQRGIKTSDSTIRATRIKNTSQGGVFHSDIEGITMSVMPHDFAEPYQGYVANLEVSQGSTKFDLVSKVDLKLDRILKECKPMIDEELFENTNGKNYDDTVTNAFKVLEERLRKKLGLAASVYGDNLINYAFNPETGKISLGETIAEKQAVFFLFKGVNGWYRNPAAHRFIRDEGFTTFQVISIVDYLLKLIK